MPFGNSLVTSTKSAQAFAKREMNIETNPLASVAFDECPLDRSLPFVRIDRILFPVRHCGIASVAGSGNVVFLNQVVLHREIMASKPNPGLNG